MSAFFDEVYQFSLFFIETVLCNSGRRNASREAEGERTSAPYQITRTRKETKRGAVQFSSMTVITRYHTASP